MTSDYNPTHPPNL